MSETAHRLLGFAFASADLLVEVSADGAVTFAIGAGELLAGQSETSLIGRPWASLVDRRDQPMLQALFEGLEPGTRAGPIVVRLRAEAGAPRPASLTAIRLPQNAGAISCTLSRTNEAPVDGLRDRNDFETLAATLLAERPQGLELALIELAGLAAAMDQAPEAERPDLRAQLAGVLRAQSHGGSAATDLGDDRFALVRGRGEAREALVQRVGKLMEAKLGAPIQAAAEVLPMKPGESPKQALRALRYTLDGFLRKGLGELPKTLPEALEQAMQRTLDEVGALGAAIRNRQFRLVFQPVVSLRDGALHHHEVLVRFDDQESPFPMIRMAEEMDLIQSLDVAVLEQTVKLLAGKPSLKLAVNVSGRTIIGDAFVEAATDLTRRYPGIKGRLMLELTESAAIDDLPAADRRLRALRALGCDICLDDFGAGAASLAYLQQLSLDILKIDGRYIRDLQVGGREAAFVKHLVRLCRDLKVDTLAEMVENSTAEEAVRAAGVSLGQGWLYGLPADQPGPPLASEGPPTVRPALVR